jgi:hypothetical protein
MPKPRKANRQVEHDRLKADILCYLGARSDVLVENTPTGRYIQPNGGWITIGAPGRPDIRGVWRILIARSPTTRYAGLAFAVEVKTGGGDLEAHQRRWRNRFQDLGGLYVLARSLDDVQSVFGSNDPWSND